MRTPTLYKPNPPAAASHQPVSCLVAARMITVELRRTPSAANDDAAASTHAAATVPLGRPRRFPWRTKIASPDAPPDLTILFAAKLTAAVLVIATGSTTRPAAWWAARFSSPRFAIATIDSPTPMAAGRSATWVRPARTVLAKVRLRPTKIARPAPSAIRTGVANRDRGVSSMGIGMT